MNIGYFGTPKHAMELLKILRENGHNINFVVTNPDRPQGRKKVPTPSPVKTYALENGIPVIQPEKLNDTSAIQEIISHPTDIHIVYAYGSIIPEKIFQSPRFGSINLHGSLLPEYRGASPVQTAILEGKTITGYSIQHLAKSVDSGNVVDSEEFPIELDDNSETIMNKITTLGSKRILKILESGKLDLGTEQDHDKASFCKKIRAEDRLLNFQESAISIHNRVRALYPNPIAYTHLREKRIRILRTNLPDDSVSKELGLFQGEPGSLVKYGKKSLFVICGDKKLISIEELQPEGKNPMTAMVYLNGLLLKEGERFT